MSILTCTSGLNRPEIKNSSHYKDGEFRNYVEWKEPSIVKNLPLIWDFLFSDVQRTPEITLPRQKVDLSLFNANGENQLTATWLGHSSVMINMDGYKIITDPVFEKRVSILGPTRYNGEIPINIEALSETDVVIISHDHYDHLNKFSIQFLDNITELFIAPLGIGTLLTDWGIPREKIVELDWWEEYKLDNKLMIAATPAQHFSGRSLTGRNKTLWASWVIAGPHHRIFFSGDSGYFEGFKQIGKKYGPFDMTFIECGAYGEQWHFIHMFPEEVVQAHLDLKGNILHPIHWGTFNLALHAWNEPMQRLTSAANALNIHTATPVVGETTVFGHYIPSEPWWEVKTASLNN